MQSCLATCSIECSQALTFPELGYISSFLSFSPVLLLYFSEHIYSILWCLWLASVRLSFTVAVCGPVCQTLTPVTFLHQIWSSLVNRTCAFACKQRRSWTLNLISASIVCICPVVPTLISARGSVRTISWSEFGEGELELIMMTRDRQVAVDVCIVKCVRTGLRVNLQFSLIDD